LIVKLAPLLSKYLAENKQLNLPGIGSFFYETDSTIVDDGTKKESVNIRYKNEKIDAFDAELIEYVSKETGKMKVLATSDLESQLEDVIQYLNTGKVYLLSGIGSLITKPDGIGLIFEPIKSGVNEKKKNQESIEKNIVPQAFIEEKLPGKKKNHSALIIMFLALIAIGATIWFYVRYSESHPTEDDMQTENTVQKPALDKVKNDSATVNKPAPKPSNTYTYVLETAQNPRASKRFSQLKSLNWPVTIETKDSVTYKIVIKLPAARADTTRIKDSLFVLSGKRVVIEQ
jgi:nucleoid DNA-binding protein